MKYIIKNRWTQNEMFACELAPEYEAATEARKLGAAVLEAKKRDAYLRGAYLSGAYLSGAYLRDADLRGADLRGADLSGAYLSGADLRGADLRDAYLSGAYLRGAYLSDAYLSGAYLSGADLGGADLGGAYLRGAYLSGAYLSDADLGEIGGKKLTLLHGRSFIQLGPIGSRSDFVLAFNTNAGIYIATGSWCFFGSISTFEKQVSEVHGDNQYGQEYAAFVAMVKAYFAAQPRE